MPPIQLSYIPYNVAQSILQEPNKSPVGHEDIFDAVALFADVSGFSSMSEALGKSGKAGTEELTSILNSYFQPMIDLIQSYGGIVGKFGGDALTVLFPYTAETQATVARRAVQCAVAMQADMGRYEAIQTSAGVYALAMKAGLAMGRVLNMSVGDPSVRLEYIIAGELLDASAEAEHHATRGEIVVQNSMLNLLGAVDIQEVRGDFTCLRRLAEPAPTAPLEPLGDVPEAALPTLAAYLHPILAQRVAAGQTGFINEHRKVTSLFVNFTGFDYDHDPAVGQKLQPYLTDVIHIIQRYDGYLNKVDMGDKGSKYIIVFGAPVAHENDEERALRCALDLRQLPQAVVQIGINTGFVYCGQVGSSVRQEYTVMGDAVVLSARLMQAAQPGQILVSSTTQRAAGSIFTWQDLPPIRVKGKSSPILLYELLGLPGRTETHLPEATYALPLVGRRDLLETAETYLERAERGQGQILGITAEAGLGKSRLNAEIIRIASGRGFRVFIGESQSYGTNVTYLAWHNIWRAIFEISAQDSTAQQLQQLETRLSAVNPDFVQRMPLLGAVVNLIIPDNRLTESLDGKTRLDLLFSLLLDCLRDRARTGPLLLVLEDGHWMDAGSLELLAFIGRNLVDLPVLLTVVYRLLPSDDHLVTQLRRFTHFHEIELLDFNEEESNELILLKLAQLSGAEIELPESVIERMVIRAGGNPFYLEEILNYIAGQGIDLKDAAALEAMELPDSLHSLIISRIDQLSESEKMVLKIASVIGRLFKAHWIWSAYPVLGEPEKVRRYLENLHFRDLTPLDRPEPELEYLFKHILTQEVAYDSMAFATREQLHAELGGFLERAYPDQIAQYVPALAFHYGRSRDTEKQRLYFRQAADTAKAAYSNEIAVDYFQRLLKLLPENESAAVLYEIAEVWQWIGRWEEAESTYRQVTALTQASGDSRTHARTQCALGDLLTSTGSYEEATTQLLQARTTFETLDDKDGRMLALGRLSVAYLRQAQYAQVAAASEELLQLAVPQNHFIGQVEANMNLAWMYLDQGNVDDALTSLQRALDLSIEHHYQRGIMHASNDIARAYLAKGDFQSAMTACQRSITVAIEIGYRRFVGIVASNVGELYHQFGDFERALACRVEALLVFIELGDWTSGAITLMNIGEMFSLQGRTAEAERFLARAADLLRQFNIPFILNYCLYLQAQNAFLQQRFAEAEVFNREALEVAATVEDKQTLFQGALLGLRVRFLLGQLDAASGAAELDTLAAEWTADEEQVALHYERWRLNRENEEARQQAAQLYRTLYEGAPNEDFRRRYLELTGEALTPNQTLADLVGVPMRTTLDLNQLVGRLQPPPATN